MPPRATFAVRPMKRPKRKVMIADRALIKLLAQAIVKTKSQNAVITLNDILARIVWKYVGSGSAENEVLKIASQVNTTVAALLYIDIIEMRAKRRNK